MQIKRVLEFLVDFIPQRFALALVFISIVLLGTFVSSSVVSHLVFCGLRWAWRVGGCWESCLGWACLWQRGPLTWSWSHGQWRVRVCDAACSRSAFSGGLLADGGLDLVLNSTKTCLTPPLPRTQMLTPCGRNSAT